jgi:hypothetical protein
MRNLYFENYEQSREQELIEDLVIESIKMYGVEVWYLPRTIDSEDGVLHEDDLSTFDDAYLLEMYIKNVDGFEGEGDFLSKIGIQIRDSMTLTVSMRRFNEDVGGLTTQVRPNEGDLIYFPLNNKMFEVMHVEHEAIFYQMGQLQTYDLRLELFSYSGERFNTDNDILDELFDSINITSNTAYSNIESVDPFADNSTLQQEASEILDFTEDNPFGENTW